MADIEKQQGETHSIPVMQESLVVSKEQVETGVVRVKKLTHEMEQPIAMTLQSQTVDVMRVPVNKVVEQVFEAHQEGDTLVVPVFEEVMTKQIILKEEVRITVRSKQQDFHENVVLKTEEAVVERLDADTDE